MDNNLVEQAINSALKCNWAEAIKANKAILLEDPEDTEALNRLARAYCESGNIKKAKKTSLKVLEIDLLNKIAEKALIKYKSAKKSNIPGFTSANASDFIGAKALNFIEEVGTTKQTGLLNLCSDDLISSLDSGDEVFLSTHTHRVTITTKGRKYIGKLPDDLSARLRQLSKNGYKYKVLIKSADKEAVKIFIKETERGKGYENIQSFPRETSESISEFDP